jgi:hypothetical protein
MRGGHWLALNGRPTGGQRPDLRYLAQSAAEMPDQASRRLIQPANTAGSPSKADFGRIGGGRRLI